MKSVIIFIGVLWSVGAVLDQTQEWNEFKTKHNKSYKHPIEEQFRMKIFLDNKKKIEKHNLRYEKGLESFKMGLNQFSDMLTSEVIPTCNCLKSRRDLERKSGTTHQSPRSPRLNLPKSVDWRTKGAVTEVKDEGSYHSSYAFAVTGAIEGQHFLKTGKLVSLSEQQLVDCFYPNRSRYESTDLEALRYVSSIEGIDTEESYPYKASQNDECLFNKSTIGATIEYSVFTYTSNENEFAEIVATVGPVITHIDANHDSFKSYSGGIYYEPNCDPDPDHGNQYLLVVGYGTTDDGEDYWIVKNSWGENWGEEGYIRMARNRDHNCGIGHYAAYPVV